MEKTRVLFVNQEIAPYLKDSPMSVMGRTLPQAIQEFGKEIRIFMPRFGSINERRNQLHEVIRLSGMNIIIDDLDHPLIIKVASLPLARIQIYFIDNEDLFSKKVMLLDKNGAPLDETDTKSIFFARGVIETAIKLNWAPQIVHCNGWFTTMTPLYMKRLYKQHPLFERSRFVLSLHKETYKGPLSDSLERKFRFDGIGARDIKRYAETDYEACMKAAIDLADAVVIADPDVSENLISYAKTHCRHVLAYKEVDFANAINDLYDKILPTK